MSNIQREFEEFKKKLNPFQFYYIKYVAGNLISNKFTKFKQKSSILYFF